MNRKEKLDNMLCEKNGVFKLLMRSEREPLQFTVTVKAGYHAKSMKEQKVKAYRVKKELLELELVNLESPEGHLVKAYNAERTVCDLLCSRSNVEIQDLQSAMKEYLRSKEKNLPQLMRYAKEFRVEKILRPYLEVLL